MGFLGFLAKVVLSYGSGFSLRFFVEEAPDVLGFRGLGVKRLILG